MSIYSVESQLNGEGMIDTGEKKKTTIGQISL